MDNDRDTTEHVMNLLEDLHALEARLADVRREREDLLTNSFHLAKTTVDPEAKEEGLMRAIILSLELKEKEEGLMRRGLDIRAEIVQIVVDAEVKAVKAAKRIDALEAALRESHPKAPPIWSGWSL